jgi:hypothetical protein
MTFNVKTDINVASKSNKQKNKKFLVAFLSVTGVYKDPEQDPDPLVRDMDPRIRIRTKMSRIPNTAVFCNVAKRKKERKIVYFFNNSLHN